MANYGLHDVERNAGVRSERDKRVPQRVERRLWGLRAPPFYLNRRDYASGSEDSSKFVPYSPLGLHVVIRQRRQDIAAAFVFWRLFKRRAQCGMNRYCDDSPVVALCLLRNELDDS